MGEIGGFKKFARAETPERAPAERVGDHFEFVRTLPLVELREQGARCMECGVPFCHNGCPLGNLIPDWNDLVYRDRWREAIDQLHRTKNFPEFTGRLCPAPCEAACVLEIEESNAVTIKQIELAIVSRAWDEGWIAAQPPSVRTDRSVAVVGSGPAGLACAQQLNRAGHSVTVFERDEAAGGLLRFGIPDFKIEKHVVERRVQQLVDEGVEFRVGVDAQPDDLEGFDATVLCTGSRVPRDLPVDGRALDGVHFAMEYLYVRNRWVAGSSDTSISAAGRNVIVIGGGDTGADCVGNSIREGAASVVQLELLPEPPASRPDERTPWPLWPLKFRLSYAMEEAKATGRGEQDFSVVTTEFTGNGRVQKVHYAQAQAAPPFGPVEGTDGVLDADLVLLAMGFLHPEHAGAVDQLQVEKDPRGNVRAPTYATSVDGVFAAGDARRGQSLIVWAINEGRQCARMVDRYLEGLDREPVVVGGGDADEGPEGPPQVASPGL